MSRRAFVPAPLIEAQPRVYRSFRGRQLKGLLFGAGGAVLVLILLGLRDFTGYALAFVASLPGFAYGYFQPEGRPLEEWLKVLYRYYATPQRISALPPRRQWQVLRAQFDPVLNAVWHTLWWRDNNRRERLSVGR